MADALSTRARLATLTFLALGCNDVFGLEPGKPWPSGTGGGGEGMKPTGQGGSAMIPGSGGTTNGGSAGVIGGTGAEGGAGRGGNGVETGGAGSDMGGSGGTSGDGGSGGDDSCASTIDCRERGLDWPYLCLSGGCVNITSNECKTVLGADWVDSSPEDEPFLVGAYGKFDVESIEGYAFYWSFKLAMQEFTDYGRIPIDGAERRPVMILCDSPPGSDMTVMFRGLSHLIDDLGVSGILMAASRLELMAAAQYAYVSNQKDVFFLDFAGANLSMLQLNDAARLWHMLGDTQLIALPFVPLVERVEEHVNPGASSGGALRPTRLVLLTPAGDDGYEKEVSQILGEVLRINGTGVDETLGTYRNVVATGVPAADAEAVAELEPDIVVDFGLTSPIEAEVDRVMRDRSRPPPFYVLPPSRLHSSVLYNQVLDDPTLRTRIIGINYAAAEDRTLYEAYLERVGAIAPATVDARNTENIYDAAYFLVYSAIAGGSGGTRVRDGMKRLVARSPRGDIGPGESMRGVLRRLAIPDAKLSLYGTMGPPEFHLPTGGRIEYGSAWCILESGVYARDVLTYDPVTRELVGTLPCFPF